MPQHGAHSETSLEKSHTEVKYSAEWLSLLKPPNKASSESKTIWKKESITHYETHSLTLENKKRK